MYKHESGHGLSQPLPHTDRIKSELWEAQQGEGGGGAGFNAPALTLNVHIWMYLPVRQSALQAKESGPLLAFYFRSGYANRVHTVF